MAEYSHATIPNVAQCDQMVRLFTQYLAMNYENLSYCIKNIKVPRFKVLSNTKQTIQKLTFCHI